MSTFEIEVTRREGTGKKLAAAMRREGRVPGVFYTHGEAAVSISLSAVELATLLRKGGRSHLIKVKSADKALSGQHVLLKELQRDVIRDTPLHVDLMGVALSEAIHVQVPIRFDGAPIGEDKGGTTEHALQSLDVACRADSIPEEIVVDVREMDVGDTLHAGDLALPKGVTLHTDAATVVVHVAAPRKVADEAAPASEA
jgi:large subunit ribosomal protein L25